MDDDWQGDIEHYSVQKQITRRLNKKSPGFLAAVRMIWEATRAEMVDRLGTPSVVSVPDGGDGAAVKMEEQGSGVVAGEEESCGIDKAAFVCLMVKVHHLIICPPVRFHIDSSGIFVFSLERSLSTQNSTQTTLDPSRKMLGKERLRHRRR